MNVFELTRALIDIESITPNEREVGEYLYHYLADRAAEYHGQIEVLPVETDRSNILVTWGQPVVTFSTHIDTVPPFIPSREDDEHIWGRGACDTKGIIAAMIKAVEALLADGVRNLALLFVVGEERNSAGAYAMSKDSRGSRYLVNGEPTENKLALGSKGALRYEITSSGRMAHSAYPELGESAIDKLVDALQNLRQVQLPRHPILGASTMNIGTLTGGRAPNVIPDHAMAEVFIRLVDDGNATAAAVEKAVAGKAVASEVLRIPALELGARPGFDTTIVSYTTDIPAFQGAWGQPFLLGPGSIHVAHTSEERIPKDQLQQAVTLYQRLARELLHS